MSLNGGQRYRQRQDFVTVNVMQKLLTHQSHVSYRWFVPGLKLQSWGWRAISKYTRRLRKARSRARTPVLAQTAEGPLVPVFCGRGFNV